MIRLAEGLTIPLDAVTKTFGILAQRRKGKTYTASVMAEEFVAAGITDAGLDAAGVAPGNPSTTDELLDMWRSALRAGARKMLDILVYAYPEGMSRDELAERVYMTATGGTFQTYLSDLRRNGLADVEGGELRASDTLFVGVGA